jgi:hypothetical protein
LSPEGKRVLGRLAWGLIAVVVHFDSYIASPRRAEALWISRNVWYLAEPQNADFDEQPLPIDAADEQIIMSLANAKLNSPTKKQ